MMPGSLFRQAPLLLHISMARSNPPCDDQSSANAGRLGAYPGAYRMIATIEELDELVNAIRAAGELAIDTETDSLSTRLANDGALWFTTDHAQYFAFALDEARASGLFAVDSGRQSG